MRDLPLPVRSRALAERLKLSVTLTFKRGVCAAGLLLAVAAGSMSAPALSAERFKCRVSEQMLDEALRFYSLSEYGAARQRFECLIAQGNSAQKFYSTFYLGRIFGDNNGSETNHEKALTIFNDFYLQHAGTDPDDPRRAPFVAKAITAVGMYYLRGSTDAGTRPDSAKAADLFKQAASIYDEPDSQYELAKLLLVGDGVAADTELALHYLQKLSRESHAGAQAFMSDLLWRGKYVPRQPAQAGALIQLALENASASDRLWIEDIYQNIYCGMGEGIRQQLNGLVGNWRRQFVKPLHTDPVVPIPQSGELSPVRTCSNGEAVVFPQTRAPSVRNGATTPADGTLSIGATTLDANAPRR